MITAKAATLEDALAAIGELKTLVQKQAEEIVDLKKNWLRPELKTLP